jgi:hypothetical protein
MTRKPIDYSKTLIYYVYHNNILLYVGHTTDNIRRKGQHKIDCYNVKGKRYNYKFYKHIRDNEIEWNEIRWEYDKYPCNDVYEAERQEGLKIRELKPLCNMVVPRRTKKEYYNDNIDKIKEKQQVYRIENKDELKKYMNQYQEDNIEKIKENKKEYYENNKEVILKKTKDYATKNEEKIKERQSIKIKCEVCNIEILKYGMKRHENSDLHKRNL